MTTNEKGLARTRPNKATKQIQQGKQGVSMLNQYSSNTFDLLLTERYLSSIKDPVPVASVIGEVNV